MLGNKPNGLGGEAFEAAPQERLAPENPATSETGAPPSTAEQVDEHAGSVPLWRKLLQRRLAVAGLATVALLIAIALLAPWLAPYSPEEMTGSFNAAPDGEHWLGTDQLGRDVLSRIIYAARVSLAVGFVTMAISVVLGTLIGLVSAYYGGWLDMLMMRVTDVFIAFPTLLVVLVVIATMGSGLTTVILVLAFFSWPDLARLVRGQVLVIKQQEYMKAGVVLGLSAPRLLFVHALPNAIGPIVVNATYGVSAAILSEASLSFLGMGIGPPHVSWGGMLSDAQSLSVLTERPWLWLPPGIVIMVTVLAINYIGSGLRDSLARHNG
ncbi:ABC transporter permease [Paenibacillus hemerocallicola]|uniref:ABC transporter permease n=1 Tax=Paenibacillus hemerocallicola TaxID=1172614 RepID=A0A5C4TEQ4_9BACL|nr:ABC transporter permease [Paenibacillus hemerocallicola]TNJ66970.1 ABC transporter permease [Paenibacillus hemerocallicola]